MCELNGYSLTPAARVKLKVTLLPAKHMCELKGYTLTRTTRVNINVTL